MLTPRFSPSLSLSLSPPRAPLRAMYENVVINKSIHNRAPAPTIIVTFLWSSDNHPRPTTT